MKNEQTITKGITEIARKKLKARRACIIFKKDDLERMHANLIDSENDFELYL